MKNKKGISPLKKIKKCDCDCHLFIGGSRKPCPDCQKNKIGIGNNRLEKTERTGSSDTNSQRVTMSIYKQWKQLEKGASISLENWEELKDLIWKQQLKIEELTKSRENWKKRALKK